MLGKPEEPREPCLPGHRVVQHIELSPPALPMVRRYQPQPDITTYELAVLIPYLVRGTVDDADVEALGAAARHLT